MDTATGFRRIAGIGLGLSLIGAALAAAALAAGCGGSVDDAESAARTVPSDDVLCQIFEEYAPQGTAAYWPGSLGSDVIAALGEPNTRDGDVWVYEWCVGAACSRKAGLRITLAEQSLCLRRMPIGGLFVSEIDAVGMPGKMCWQPDRRDKAPTCEGCLNAGEVKRCPSL